jgi:hypothetical protein
VYRHRYEPKRNRLHHYIIKTSTDKRDILLRKPTEKDLRPFY